MTAPEHIDGPLASWQPDRAPAPAPAAAAAAAAAWDDAAYAPADGPEPARKFSARVVTRAIRRNWWQILLLWAVVAAPLVTLIYLRVMPTYDATAYVRIEPPTNLGGLIANANTVGPVEAQLETEVQRMTTPDILGMALQDERVAALPRVQSALDAEAFLRQQLRVQVVPRTRFITVGMTSPSSAEAVAIVNAVARAYEKSATALTAADTRKQTKSLEDFHAEKNKEVEEKQATLKDLVSRIDGRAGFLPEGAGGPDDRTALDQMKARESISVEEFKAVAGQLNGLEMDLMEAEKRLDRLKAEARRSTEAVKRDQDVEREVRDHPEVVRLADEHKRARQQLDRARELVPATDIARIRAQQKVNALKDDYRATVERLRPAVRQRIERATAGVGEGAVRDAEDLVARLTARREHLQKKMKDVKVEVQRNALVLQKDSLEIELAKQDLTYSRSLRDKVRQQLDVMQVNLDGSTNKVYVTPASISNAPITNKRTQMMAAAPAGALAVVLALFVLLEMGAGRVADPDDLPGRLRLGVIGVVPPLPTAGPARGALPWGNGPEKARQRVEEFVQSLDHLRVQLWAGRRPGAGHRCVLITSACVSEGKTTLAAQLAGRCANAGMSTLLIDADLRRPALARLLEVPGEPGLADVLAGEVEPEGAMTVIGNAGGFHLMPAGRRGRDPGRLLEAGRLGPLLDRLRETFDIIIVDAPPVLPVPDALVLGRHADGAILAVRHDSSRYPLLERARAKLASVGVPILGAVINGVRGTGAHYGNYAYTAAAADEAPDGPDAAF